MIYAAIRKGVLCLHMKEISNNNETITNKKKSNLYCEIGFILGVFSFFYSGFFAVPVLAAIISLTGILTIKNSRHKDKWKAYWGLFLGTLLAMANFV